MKLVSTLAVALVTVMVLMAGSTANVNGNSFGSPKAPLTLEVFSDFQCPGCKAFHDQDLPRIMTDYVTTGKIYLIYRYFPLDAHVFGRTCAEWACAASRIGRYEKVSEALFAQQSAIFTTGKIEEALVSALTPTEMTKVKSLLKSPEVKRQIDTDLEEGKAVPVPSTPTLLVTAHGKSQPVVWPLNYTLFKSYIDGLLAK